MIYITGDTHGQFGRIEAFCKRFGTSKDDVMIILGDAGINFGGGILARRQKEFLESLP
ncbi:MAG: metallophosphoesterase, partial [Lachnospiraceae bacterium]|nr:metallophosphoesterase [Lachnospiraceae bacterium]